MKKKLEAELISIAHRILKMKNRSELAQLQKEAQKLYEKLSIMVFVEDNFAEAKPTIGQAEVVDQIEQIFGTEQEVDEDAPDAKESSVEKTRESSDEDISVETKSEIDSDKSEDSTITEKDFDAKAEQSKDPTSDTNEDTEISDGKPESKHDRSSEEEKASDDDSDKAPNSSEVIFTPNIDLEEDKSEIEPREINQLDKPKETNILEGSPDDDQKEASYTAEKSNDDLQNEKSSGGFDTEFSESEKTETMIAAESNTQIPTAHVTENKQDDKLNQSLTFEPTIDKKGEAPKFGYGNSGRLPLDDLYGDDYKDPEFIKPEDLAKEQSSSRENVIPISGPDDNTNVFSIKKDDPKSPLSLNDRLSKGITIGLNDRIAFMKHLFNNSSEDYNRVLSQLITFDNYPDAVNFIDTMVKPDYNEWEGKDDYSQRFMEIIERKFN